tara:strand:+ start:157 stop:738 length:582 start_codon:yes stop_codon:yes gene_type:complete
MKVTDITILANVIFFLINHISHINIFYNTYQNITFVPYLILEKGEYYRLITSNFFHKNIFHLLTNVYSFYGFSYILENQFRNSVNYAVLIFFLGITSNIIIILFSIIEMYLFKTYSIYYTQILGFSGIIFGLKVILLNKFNINTQYFGIVLNPNQTMIFELILASVMFPNVSFYGHLSGIISGILYINYYSVQ